ncbi:metal ABC transporter substrate-binding protein [bacterium]|nr:metal ABC transporter substrate-binding protein [bacterium]
MQSSFADQKLRVVTSTPDIAWLFNQIGGSKVKTESLLNGTENPHFVDAMPHFVSKVADADIVCVVGMELELAWMPKVLSKSGNSQVQSGGKGHCEAGKTVTALDVPTSKIDRSMGDVHPQGNPHFHLSPEAMIQAGETVLETLISVSPSHAETFLKNFTLFENRLKAIKTKVSSILLPLKGKNIMEYHKEYSYFLNSFGLTNIGAIEKVPGVTPSAGRIARVSFDAKKLDVHLAIAAENSPRNILKKFSSISKVRHVILPLSITKPDNKNAYEDFLTEIASKLAGIKKNVSKKQSKSIY